MLAEAGDFGLTNGLCSPFPSTPVRVLDSLLQLSIPHQDDVAVLAHTVQRIGWGDVVNCLVADGAGLAFDPHRDGRHSVDAKWVS